MSDGYYQSVDDATYDYGEDQLSRELKIQDSINRTVDLYADAKRAETGATIRCPSCEKLFVKKSYQQAFCRNKGKGNCKDRYHNRTNPRAGSEAMRLELIRQGKIIDRYMDAIDQEHGDYQDYHYGWSDV